MGPVPTRIAAAACGRAPRENRSREGGASHYPLGHFPRRRPGRGTTLRPGAVPGSTRLALPPAPVLERLTRMSRLSYPLVPDGPLLPALIGLPAPAMQALQAQ